MRNQTEPVLSSYLHAKGRKLGLPIAGNFELTARCNFNCPMCYVHLSQDEVNKRGKELSAKQWIELAQQAKNQGMIFLLLTGGEPFVRKDFFEIYEACKEMGLVVSINSNASLLKGEILERLLENPPFRMNISLYGASADTYRRMCGLPVFDEVVESITKLKQAGVEVRLNLTMTPYNQQDLEQIYALSVKLDVPVRAANYMYPAVRVDEHVDADQSRLSAKESVECAVLWDKLRFTEEEFQKRALAYRQMTLNDVKECPAEWDEGMTCRAGTTSFWVCWDGKMRPCGLMSAPEADLNKMNFQQAWEVIKQKTKEIRMPSQCTTCAKRNVCGVCAAICQAETGSTEKVPVYVCAQTDEMIRRMSCEVKEEVHEAE